MTGGRKVNPHEPTDERTADQSTQTTGGLHQAIKPGPGPEVAREEDVDDVLNRDDKHGSHG